MRFWNGFLNHTEEERDTAMSRETIAAIRKELEAAGLQQMREIEEKYGQDERAGVGRLLEAYRRRMEKLEAEYSRIEAMKAYEREYWEQGYRCICGIDEAGRGPLAGPVVAGAVILPRDCNILYINDSKKLSPKKREELYGQIMEEAVSVGVGYAGPERIDEINILQATYEAMRMAVSKLSEKPDVLLNDAVCIPGISVRQVPIVKGDGKSLSIAAASIIAKVTRDRLMEEYDRRFPEYGFAAHKGYGSAAHIRAIQQYGPSPIHRKSFIGHPVDVRLAPTGAAAEMRECGARSNPTAFMVGGARASGHTGLL